MRFIHAINVAIVHSHFCIVFQYVTIPQCILSILLMDMYEFLGLGYYEQGCYEYS